MMSLHGIISRRGALAAVTAFALSVFAAPAALADEAAEDFMRGILEEANQIFQANDEQSRLDGVEKMVNKYVDMKRVSMFVLGQYARKISDEQKQAYVPLFQRYATLVYQEALESYSGERLEVVDSVDRSPRDIIVNTRVANAKPGDKFADTVFHWRVYRSIDGEMSVFDAGANGVWLAIEQQSQFKSVIANNGGGSAGIDALIADLREKLEN